METRLSEFGSSRIENRLYLWIYEFNWFNCARWKKKEGEKKKGKVIIISEFISNASVLFRRRGRNVIN